MNSDLSPYVPYQGSKNGIVEQIYNTIRQLNIPRPTLIKAPFAGGGALEYYLAMKGFKVEASDIDSSLVRLHNCCRDIPEDVIQWGKHAFTKAEFKEVIKDDSVFSALVRSIWSFGNDGRTYLTSTEKQDAKIEDFYKGIAEPNVRFKHIEDICILWKHKPNMALTFTCKSYEDVTVNEGELAYCDPPYAGTAGYRSGAFDHDKFYAWALAQKGLVLVSEYNMPEPFVLIGQYPKWVEMSQKTRSKMAEERLYANRPVHVLSLF